MLTVHCDANVVSYMAQVACMVLTSLVSVKARARVNGAVEVVERFIPRKWVNNPSRCQACYYTHDTCVCKSYGVVTEARAPLKSPIIGAVYQIADNDSNVHQTCG